MKDEKFSTAEILNGIREGNRQMIDFIYKNYFDSIRQMVFLYKGNEDLAYDVFQEALVVIYKKSQEKEFTIDKSSFFTYFYSVCRITILSMLSKGSKDVLTRSLDLGDPLEIEDAEFEQMEQIVQQGLREQLFHTYLKKIPSSCLDILTLVMEGLQSEQIAKQLNMSSATYVRKRKKICLSSLIEMIKKDPKSKELL